jgi:hypothetical protein
MKPKNKINHPNEFNNLIIPHINDFINQQKALYHDPIYP